MRKQTALAALAMFVLGGLAPRASAVELTLRPVIREMQNLDSTPYDPSHITVIGSDGQVAVAEGAPPVVLFVDYYMSIAGLSGGPFEVGFGNVAFDLLPENLSIAAGTDGWNPDVTLTDINGELPAGETLIWADNGDFGSDGADLEWIVVGLAPMSFGDPTLDARYTLGQQSPVLIGSTLLSWDPAANASAGLDVDIEAFSTFGSDMRLRRRPQGIEVAGDLRLLVSPGLTGDTDKDGDVDLDDLNNVRNHFDETGENIPGDTVPYDGVVDLIDLNRVYDNYGASIEFPGNLTSVPEPSTLGLIGVFAVTAMFWRRKWVHA
jgi:hypothetical protein